ncbi:MAG: RES family NAD+ phosphorylase [Dehalococcoidia bacterium]
MTTVRRISAWKWRAGAFSGEGAKISGGRWNSPGSHCVYTSVNRALAVLEVIVHAAGYSPSRPYGIASAAIPDNLTMEIVETSGLPLGWDRVPANLAIQAIGDDWLRRASTAVLVVPSVLVPGERNFLLNPGHPDFGRIQVNDMMPLILDRRLFLR